MTAAGFTSLRMPTLRMGPHIVPSVKRDYCALGKAAAFVDLHVPTDGFYSTHTRRAAP